MYEIATAVAVEVADEEFVVAGEPAPSGDVAVEPVDQDEAAAARRSIAT